MCFVGFSLGDELGFNESLSNVENNRRRSAQASRLQAQLIQAQQKMKAVSWPKPLSLTDQGHVSQYLIGESNSGAFTRCATLFRWSRSRAHEEASVSDRSSLQADTPGSRASRRQIEHPDAGADGHRRSPLQPSTEPAPPRRGRAPLGAQQAQSDGGHGPREEGASQRQVEQHEFRPEDFALPQQRVATGEHQLGPDGLGRQQHQRRRAPDGDAAKATDAGEAQAHLDHAETHQQVLQ